MTTFRLSTKLTLVSGALLTLFFIASAGVLFKAQSQQAFDEMDLVLRNQSQALSSFANTTENGKLDFEMNPAFSAQYSAKNQNSFYRFYDLKEDRLLNESLNAPQVDCASATVSLNQNFERSLFRVMAYRFSPDSETGAKADLAKPKLCLVVGIDQAPYRLLVTKTLLSSIPVLMALVIALIAALLILVRRLTRDLSSLTTALETANFGATHEFPVLPRTTTLEVSTVIEKLSALHANAARVYREMWLFLGRASHQLKTPVTAMQATIEVLLRKERTRDELLAGLLDVQAAAAQLSDLTKNLVTSSRISYEASTLEKRAVDIRDFLRSQVTAFSAAAALRGVALKIQSDSEIWALGNSFLMSEIFGNLIENAILYSAQKGPNEVVISWSIEQKNVLVVISDQGPGLPSQVIDSLFKPFVRGDESQFSGSGLGLSTAKKAAELLGGDVVVKQTNQSGTKIVVILEVAAKACA